MSTRILHPIICLLIVAFLLVDACLWLGRRGTGWANMPIEIAFALVFGQVSLLATWIGIGRGKFASRFFAGALGLALLWAIIEKGSAGPQAFALLIVTQSVLITLAMQFAGYCLVLPETTEGCGTRKTPLQFSIANLFQITTIAAVLLGMSIRLTIASHIAWEGIWLALAFGVPVPLIGLAVLGESHTVPRALAALVAALLAIGSLWFFWPYPTRATSVQMCLWQYVLVAAALLAARVAGYRLNRRVPAKTRNHAEVNSDAELAIQQ